MTLIETNKFLERIKREQNIDDVLFVICANGNLELVKLLLEHGADVHADDDRALRNAYYFDHLEIVKYLENYDLLKKITSI
jgi:ankyrin repeat protein